MQIGTRARKQLRQWMAQDASTRTQSAIAAALGVKQPAVSQWLDGKARPDALRGIALERLTDGAVVAVDWLSSEERASRAALDAVGPMRTSHTGSD